MAQHRRTSASRLPGLGACPGLSAWCGCTNLLAIASGRPHGNVIPVLLLEPRCLDETTRLEVPAKGGWHGRGSSAGWSLALLDIGLLRFSCTVQWRPDIGHVRVCVGMRVRVVTLNPQTLKPETPNP